MSDQPKHEWPADGGHLWSRWYAKTGLPKPTQYRVCVHPDCNESETREAPRA